MQFHALRRCTKHETGFMLFHAVQRIFANRAFFFQILFIVALQKNIVGWFEQLLHIICLYLRDTFFKGIAY
jgi:hypothetical protein